LSRLGSQAAKFEKQIAELKKTNEDALEKAKLGELEAATSKITRLESSIKEVEDKAVKKEIEAEIKLAAIAAGVPLEKAKLVLKLTEYTPVDGVVDNDAIHNAVKAVLAEVPELIKAPIVVDAKTVEPGKAAPVINGVASSVVSAGKPKTLAEAVAAKVAEQKR
jgi:arsenate reductase-like glutaredoxin family protein